MSRRMNNNGTLNAYLVQGDEIQKDDRYGYKIIAVVFDENSWCAFRGLTDMDDDYISRCGDEVPYEAARYLFSTLANNLENYGNW